MQSSFTLPEFSLKGTDGMEHGPSPGGDSNATLILFLCNHCPYVHRYTSRIKDLVEKYSSQGLEVFGINSNDASRYPEDGFENMAEIADRMGLGGNYLHDETQEVAQLFRPERTPEAYLFNGTGELVYRGAIDDNNANPKEVKTRYLEEAIDAVFLNKVIQISYEAPVGCTIKWKQHG